MTTFPFQNRSLLVLTLLLALPGSFARAQADADRPSRREITPHEERTLHSALLKKDMLQCVYLPPNYDGSGKTKYPVLYYLHGLNNDARRFFREGLPEATTQLITEKKIAPLIIVCPAGDASFYVNKKDGSAPYEDYVSKEVPEFIQGQFPVRSDRDGRAIGGISMGGYGALKIGMGQPKLFGAASGHTPFMLEKIPDASRTDRRSQQLLRIFKGIFGDPIDPEMWKANDPFELARKGGFEGLPIYFNSASKDRYFLNRESTALHTLMDEKKIAHQFHAIDDVHGWVSLQHVWPEILEFHSKAFKAAP